MIYTFRFVILLLGIPSALAGCRSEALPDPGAEENSVKRSLAASDSSAADRGALDSTADTAIALGDLTLHVVPLSDPERPLLVGVEVRNAGATTPFVDHPEFYDFIVRRRETGEVIERTTFSNLSLGHDLREEVPAGDTLSHVVDLGCGNQYLVPPEEVNLRCDWAYIPPGAGIYTVVVEFWVPDFRRRQERVVMRSAPVEIRFGGE